MRERTWYLVPVLALAYGCGTEPGGNDSDPLAEQHSALQRGGRPAHCGEGEARAALQNLPRASAAAAAGTSDDEGSGGLNGALDCQYRFFLPQSPFTQRPWTFCEHERFLGGIVLLDPLDTSFCDLSFEFGCTGDAECPLEGETCVDTYDEVVADLARYSSTLHFGPADGSLEEVPLLRTTYKDVDHPTFGYNLWFQEGAILQRGPGTYLSDWQFFFDGEPIDGLQVTVEVVSHEEHLAREAAGTWR